MKTSKPLITIGAALLLCAGASAQAQITWDAPQTITADTDVATNGTLVSAYFYNYDSTSVAPTAGQTDVINGVTFTVENASTAGFTSDSSEGPYSYGYDTFFPNAASEASYSGSSAYTLLLGGALAYTGDRNAPETLTLTGLTAGNTYEFEYWDNDTRGGRADWSETATDGTSVTTKPTDAVTGTGTGQFAIGTFVASSGSEIITFAGNATYTAGDPPTVNGTATQVDAYQLRDLGVESIPEPSTVALVGLGALGLAFLIRRHRTV